MVLNRCDDFRRLSVWALVWFGLVGISLQVRAGALPQISFLEPFLKTNVLIHFDTEANRTYTLQYTETLPFGANQVFWTNLYTAPALPFANHYVVLDTGTRRQRYYRLMASP